MRITTLPKTLKSIVIGLLVCLGGNLTLNIFSGGFKGGMSILEHLFQFIGLLLPSKHDFATAYAVIFLAGVIVALFVWKEAE